MLKQTIIDLIKGLSSQELQEIEDAVNDEWYVAVERESAIKAKEYIARGIAIITGQK